MIGYKNQSVEISCKLDDGNTLQFPYAVIKKTDGKTETSLTLNHMFSGQYTNNSWTPVNNGYFKANYAVYSDLAHTILNTNYSQGAETIWVIDELPTSSQVTESTYGGGGRGQVAVVGGRKSPWTHKQRDDIIKNVEDTKAMVSELNKKVEEYYKNEMASLEELINNLEQLYSKVKTTAKSDTDKILAEVAYSIRVLKENRDKLKNMSTLDEIPNIKKDIAKVSKMAILLLSNEKLEEFIKEDKKNG